MSSSFILGSYLMSVLNELNGSMIKPTHSTEITCKLIRLLDFLWLHIEKKYNKWIFIALIFSLLLCKHEKKSFIILTKIGA